jgi:hypothetical protein
MSVKLACDLAHSEIHLLCSLLIAQSCPSNELLPNSNSIVAVLQLLVLVLMLLHYLSCLFSFIYRSPAPRGNAAVAALRRITLI